MLCQLKGIGRLPFGRASSASYGQGQGVVRLQDRVGSGSGSSSGRDAVQRAAATTGGGHRKAGQVFVAGGEPDVHPAVTADAELPVLRRW